MQLASRELFHDGPIVNVASMAQQHGPLGQFHDLEPDRYSPDTKAAHQALNYIAHGWSELVGTDICSFVMRQLIYSDIKKVNQTKPALPQILLVP